ncbi:Cell division control protein 14, SIN component [Geosmithia morbida]|uniref:Cell division control protein 14, SIN component n=1 Tax=Geosmithia morbida TaxID=1094350 RepID=A0A9P4Z2L3_9HYPO|nr:Cell division control protein 14, SIN component [Geosmithia morbida]KAF4126279.1 Cell division control protein 14, SIN component [Geosmithia morbida]
MEALLSVAFDNLSSYNGPKVRKGLRQIEGLLAQICLSNPSSSSSSSSSSRPSTSGSSSVSPVSPSSSDAAPSGRKDLGQLSHDPAFRQFFKLQEGFEWNVAMRLIGTLDRLMAQGTDGQNDLLILSSLDLIQGILLLHPPSKTLFSREQNMNLLLDLLEPYNCPAIQSATLLTLVVALIDTPRNTRTFEALDGLLTVTSLFKSRSTSREVKLKLVEFLYFYLMPEMPSIPRAEQTDSLPHMLQRSPSKFADAFSSSSSSSSTSSCSSRDSSASFGSSSSSAGGPHRRRTDSDAGCKLSTADKQEFLGRYLSNVDDLVKDLGNYAPFGGAVC